MKNLPRVRNKRDKTNIELENTDKLKENYNPFKAHMEKIIEIKIFLKFNFHKNDIDDAFINDLEQEYACQFLDKMQYLPTKQNIAKILKFRPIELCDFHLSQEEVRNKTVKLIHIYPNNHSNTDKKGRDKLKLLLSNEAFGEALQQNFNHVHKEDEVQKIKRREIKRDELFLFQRENIDNMIEHAKDDIIDKQLYSQNEGMNDKNLLLIDNIRTKYLDPNAKNILERNIDEKMTAKAKFQNIEGAIKKDVLNDEKFRFKFLNTKLTNEILDEVNKPIELPVEIIMKDVNFILDNFPIEELIDIDDQTLHNQQRERLAKTTHVFKEIIHAKQLYYKIKSVKKEDIIYVYKKIQSKGVFKIIGLTINLIYWIVFGYINRFQIDQATKQYLYFKLLEEIQNLEIGFKSKKLYIKIFMPLLILILRIECENIFCNKFIVLFSNRDNKKEAMEKINELVTTIFDPHAYYNTFTIIGGNTALLKHKLNKKILPQYKSKTYVTSNLIDQLFTNFKAQKNIVQHNEKGIEYGLDKDFDIAVWEQEKKYIASSKTKFFGFIFNKINQGLKKRNLEPIFTVKKPMGSKQKSHSLLNYKGEKVNNYEENKQRFANTNAGFHLDGFSDKIKEGNVEDNLEEEKEINIDDLILDDPKIEDKK
jgi:hypothetical protein